MKTHKDLDVYKNALNLSSSTQRAMKKLLETGIIDRNSDEYIFTDPFFKKFIQLRKTA